MLILNAEEIRSVFSMKEAIEADKEAFLLHSRGETEVPVRISFSVRKDDKSQFMPAFVKGDINRVGIKIVSTFMENPLRGLPVVTAQVLLLDPETGEVCAMMNGTEVTKIRTGAISGAATDILARTDAEVGALFGTGAQARSQLEAMLTARKLREVRVFDKNPDWIRSFIDRVAPMAESFGAKLAEASSSDAAIDQADVITTVTTSKTPVFDGRRVRPGAHVNGLGSYTPNARELDLELLKRSRVYVDNREAVLAEAGDFLIPIASGDYSSGRIAGELGEVLDGKVQGRTDPKDITVMKTVGYAVLDVVAAYRIFTKALALGKGRELQF
ncbi:MAG: ornithine cyclodeaminase family protein [Synergistales bacterium]